MIPWPVNMGLLDWADQVAFGLDAALPVQKLMREDEWQDWAASIKTSLAADQKDIPNPYQFSDWKQWAERFCDVAI